MLYNTFGQRIVLSSSLNIVFELDLPYKVDVRELPVCNPPSRSIRLSHSCKTVSKVRPAKDEIQLIVIM